jgi:hypothetical protein
VTTQLPRLPDRLDDHMRHWLKAGLIEPPPGGAALVAGAVSVVTRRGRGSGETLGKA